MQAGPEQELENAEAGAQAVIEPEAPRSSELPKQCPTCLARFPGTFKVCPHDATVLEEAPDDDDPLLGHTLGGSYEIVSLLGEGGMGRVYEARHTRLPKKRYAIKVIHADLVRQREVVARFRREAEAASVLLHPNVVSVYDVNAAPDGRPYIVCELLEGEQLGEYLDRVERVGPLRAVRVVRQICRALRAAHERGIVHRDIKPENVFLAKDTVKVLDFGISKLAESQSTLTKTGTVMGTPDYMAPEQARGDKVDHRADIYATGAILYRAVTGSKPFERSDPMATLTAVLAEEPPRPSSVQPSIPPALELVIQRAMSKDLSERYSTISEFEAELARLEQQLKADPAIEQPTPLPGVEDRASLLAEVVKVAALKPIGEDAEAARPWLVVLSALAFIWATTGLTDAIASLIRLISLDHASRSELTTIEAWLTLAGAIGVLFTPLLLWIRHVSRRIWTNTPRAIATARRLGQALLVSVATYGVLALVTHVMEGVYEGQARGLLGPIVNLALFAASLGTGLFAWFFTRWKRRFGDPRSADN